MRGWEGSVQDPAVRAQRLARRRAVGWPAAPAECLSDEQAAAVGGFVGEPSRPE